MERYIQLCQELFLAGTKTSFLPTNLNSNPRLAEQAAARRSLYNLFDRFFEGLPAGRQDETLLPSLWNGISDFLEADEGNERILLYLPFEVLPDFNQEAERFKELFREGWIRLLHQSESRANFVDGDILEPGLEDPERISKAGHLTPELLVKGIINPSDVVLLLEVMEEKQLLQSLAEGTIVAHDRGLMDGENWIRAKALIDEKIGPVTRPKKSDKFYNHPDSPDISENRARWLRSIEKEAKDNEEALQLAAKIIADQEPELIEGKVSALAIFEAGKIMAGEDLGKARQFSTKSEDLIKALWNSDDLEVKDIIFGGLNKWARLNIVDEEFLARFGIKLVDLTNVSVDDNEFSTLMLAAQKLKTHPVLSEFLYPGFLVFGSRVKGHADINADLDAAIFLRPDIPFEKRDEILDTLKTDLPELEPENLLEFWTVREKGRLKFTVHQEHIKLFERDDQIHFFLGGLWIDEGDLDEIRADILDHYLHLPDKRFFLGLLELDALQYRIMHKGYRKLYPLTPRKKSPNSDLIDFDSDFWDPGFRKVATKLFLSKVFLPSW